MRQADIRQASKKTNELFPQQSAPVDRTPFARQGKPGAAPPAVSFIAGGVQAQKWVMVDYEWVWIG